VTQSADDAALPTVVDLFPIGRDTAASQSPQAHQNTRVECPSKKTISPLNILQYLGILNSNCSDTFLRVMFHRYLPNSIRLTVMFW